VNHGGKANISTDLPMQQDQFYIFIRVRIDWAELSFAKPK